MTRGKLIVFYGNMFSNKTGTLIQKIETLRNYGKKKIFVAKPKTDTRSKEGYIENSEGKQMEAFEVPSKKIQDIFKILHVEEQRQGSKFDIIAIDEIQFFELTLEVFQTVRKLLEDGYDVIVAGLPLNFRGEPFGATLQLIGLCENVRDVISLSSRCSKCGKEVLLPQRLIDGKPAPYDSDEIKVGGKESYEARCYECHELPQKPRIA